MEFFWMILIGMIAGWLAGQFMTGKGFGVIGDIIVGVIGALIGGLLFQKTGIMPGSGLIGSLIVATTGAIIFLYGLRMVKKA
ncbi:GlsB/YeaQ/YmgE family stress response membrane protein [Desulfosarcina sp.]|nr:GlsB/YeaQ/YmgE family stress response membrane protein [Desulfosarcina sp.]